MSNKKSYRRVNKSTIVDPDTMAYYEKHNKRLEPLRKKVQRELNIKIFIAVVVIALLVYFLS